MDGASYMELEVGREILQELEVGREILHGTRLVGYPVMIPLYGIWMQQHFLN